MQQGQPEIDYSLKTPEKPKIIAPIATAGQSRQHLDFEKVNVADVDLNNAKEKSKDANVEDQPKPPKSEAETRDMIKDGLDTCDSVRKFKNRC
jgi:hypothetical protein